MSAFTETGVGEVDNVNFEAAYIAVHVFVVSSNCGAAPFTSTIVYIRQYIGWAAKSQQL